MLFHKNRMLISVSIAVLVSAASLSVTSNAHAAGGTGGASYHGQAGGNGGTGPDGQVGQAGASSDVEEGGGGGGGGGAGSGATVGGQGGSGGDSFSDGFFVNGASGGAGGTAVNPNGEQGGSSDGDEGAGGGGGGYSGATVTNLSNSGSLTGGSGGSGGIQTTTGAGGAGGGGEGGYGAVVTGSGPSINNGVIRGGVGGGGGNSAGGGGGSGGDGGIGILFTASGATLTNLGTISGAQGGGAGTGFVEGSNQLGAAGAGGVGVEGAGLTIINSGTISGGASGDGATRADAIDFSGDSSTLVTNGGSYTGNINIAGSLTLDQQATDGATGSATYSNAITGGGEVTIATDAGKSVTLSAANNYTGYTYISAGTLVLDHATNGAIDAMPNYVNSFIVFSGNSTLESAVSGTLTNPIEITNEATIGATAGHTLTLSSGAFFAPGRSPLTFGSAGDTGTIVLNINGPASTGESVLIGGGTLQIGNSESAGFLSSFAGITIGAAATLDLNNFATSAQTSSGSPPSISLNGGTIKNGSMNGPLTSQGGVIIDVGGFGSLITTAGTTTLFGTNAYTGATIVNGGTLDLAGSITRTSGVTVNAGGTLTGAGTLDPPTVTVASGATFAPGVIGAPGTSMAVEGNLTLASGSTYAITLSPTMSSFANITGTASLGGTVQANFANGSYISKTYTILTTTGGVTGTFAGVTNGNLPANFHDALSYTANNAFLDLTLNYQPPPPPPPPTGGNSPPPAPIYHALNRNQLAVADTLVNYFNTNGGIPTKFGALPGAALTQIDGEGNTGAEHTAFQLETEFLNVMIDPFVDGRGSDGFGASPASTGMLAYADGQTLPILKGPPPSPMYIPHWSAWGTAYGGVSNTDGNASTGSNQLDASTFGFAGGMDYHVSPETLFGFALAGGGTNWNLATLSGSGRSTALQAGVYAITHAGPLYGAADFGFTNNWFNTDRTALGDQLQANFGGQSYGGRLEGGYHLSNLPIGVTPYASVQAQEFVTPSYSENDITGGGFGLSYARMSASDVRTEIGSRFEELSSLNNMPLVLRGKLAWAHDFVSNPSLSAAFLSLPGTSFIVNGAPIPHNSALASAGAELFLAPNLSILAKFDGEFAGNSQTYGGSGTLKYTW